jgi:cytochrome c oxidase assembly factor CtaG
MLLALGAPIRLAADLLRPATRAPLSALLHSRVARGSALVATGLVYFWTRFRIDPTPRTDPYGVTIWITVVEMIGDAVLGVVLWLGPLVAAGHYAALARGWGPDLRTDQILGAGVLWIGGDVVGLPFIGIVLGLMTREDPTRAVAVDAELDAAEEAGPARLWREDVPEIADRFRRG